MTDYTELVKALRNHASKESDCESCQYYYYNIVKYDTCSSSLCAAAADAIEELRAEVDKANKSADAYRAMYFTKRGDITIEKVRELDEIDCHFHSALIRLMYKRIEELESEEKRQLPKHGEWIEDTTTYAGPGLSNYKCSLCGKICGTWRSGLEKSELPNWCGNCGADMRAKMEVQDG